MSAKIVGLGHAFPPRQLSQSRAAELAARLSCRQPRHEQLLAAIYKKSRVNTRGSVLIDGGDGDDATFSFYPPPSEQPEGPTTRARNEIYARESLPLSHAASAAALADAGVSAGTITHLITVSCTGFFAPGPDIALIRSLGLQPNVSRTHIGFMGCHGALNGLQVARAISESDPHASILLCAVELCSLHFQYGWDSDNVVANALFADGAAAAVITNTDGAIARHLKILAIGSYLLPNSEDAMSWNIEDHGFRMTLSARVPELIEQNLSGFIDTWLQRHDFKREQIESWGAHPGGPRILTAVESALKLNERSLALSRDALAQHGNMSSPTILIILEKMRNASANKPIVLLAFGPGLAIESLLLT